MRKGRREGISISPFDQLIDYFRTGENHLSCIWAENCAHTFIGISPQGNVGQCECWVASYPDFVFGNILTCGDMAEIMNSPVRKQFLQRPTRLIAEQDCAECEYLALCHGGCPVRAYSATGSLFTKDAYCEAGKTLFGLAKNAAIELDRLETMGRLDVRSKSQK
jgi:radical SAM protein with 4Fe4S-binding SPASM domain